MGRANLIYVVLMYWQSISNSTVMLCQFLKKFNPLNVFPARKTDMDESWNHKSWNSLIVLSVMSPVIKDRDRNIFNQTHFTSCLQSQPLMVRLKWRALLQGTKMNLLRIRSFWSSNCDIEAFFIVKCLFQKVIKSITVDFQIKEPAC